MFKKYDGCHRIQANVFSDNLDASGLLISFLLLFLNVILTYYIAMYSGPFLLTLPHVPLSLINPPSLSVPFFYLLI